MFVAWMGLWVGFGLISGSAIRISVARGVVAAVLSGAAFYAISGIWTRPGPGDPDYLYHYLCWTVAFLPGFLALLVGGASSSDYDSRGQSSAA
jgi:hypothetical protein